MAATIQLHSVQKRQLSIRPGLANAGIVRGLPGKAAWTGNLVVFSATREAVDYLREHIQAGITQEAADYLDKLSKPTAPPKKTLFKGFKTKSFAHQKTVFERSRDMPNFALLMEVGTGKSKVVIDTAAWLWAKGEINCLLVIANNGVHSNWGLREIPAHLSDWVPRRVHIWKKNKEPKGVFDPFGPASRDNLAIVCINIDALATDHGLQFLSRVVRAYRCLGVVDESTSIKNHRAKRTRGLYKLAGKIPYKRILTGTPVPNAPMDLFGQFMFLDGDILGHSDITSFKGRYCNLKKLWVRDPATGKPMVKKSKWGQDIQIVDGYKNLEELYTLIEPFSYRVLKEDCLDLPPKLYRVVDVSMTPQQKKLYRKCLDDIIIELDGGLTITPTIALVRIAKLQQVLCNFIIDEGKVVHPVGPINPRLQSLLTELESVDGKAIVWTTYNYSIQEIYLALSRVYGPKSVAMYAGSTPTAERERIVDRFQDKGSELRFFLGNQKAAGYGLTLTAARSSWYYNNSYNWEHREQSEGRPHRIGQMFPHTYTDFIVPGTRDAMIVEALWRKETVAGDITGDTLRKWIRDDLKSMEGDDD